MREEKNEREQNDLVGGDYGPEVVVDSASSTHDSFLLWRRLVIIFIL